MSGPKSEQEKYYERLNQEAEEREAQRDRDRERDREEVENSRSYHSEFGNDDGNF